MLTTILIIVAALVALFLIVAAVQPTDFRLSRHTTISAPPAVVFSFLDDLRKFQGWSPWAKFDPAAKNTFAGPATGVGSSFAWAGNNKVGEGRMTNIESRPPELVRFKLEFLKPFKATNEVEFTFVPKGGQTTVTWNMTGQRNLLFKAFGLIMPPEKMLGPQFEEGLATLKAQAEAVAKK